MKQWFYGIRGIEFVWHGSYSDPELIWHKKSFNYYDVESPLWEYYKEDCEEMGIKATDADFPAWVKKNAAEARQILYNLLYAGIFYR